jgi:hypothetical protein
MKGKYIVYTIDTNVPATDNLPNTCKQCIIKIIPRY